jgi:hypothetical protein
MLVDPMGTVRADLGLWPQVTVAELDSELTARARAVLPCLEHRRDDIFGPADPSAAAGLAAAAAAAGMGAPAGMGGPAGMGAPAGTADPVSRSAPATERDAARFR